MVFTFQATTFFQSGVYANHNIGEGKKKYTRGKVLKIGWLRRRDIKKPRSQSSVWKMNWLKNENM